MIVGVDNEACMGNGICLGASEAAFEIGEDGKVRLRGGLGHAAVDLSTHQKAFKMIEPTQIMDLPEALRDGVERAKDACPPGCIEVIS
jgi:ferredoxin